MIIIAVILALATAGFAFDAWTIHRLQREAADQRGALAAQAATIHGYSALLNSFREDAFEHAEICEFARRFIAETDLFQAGITTTEPS